jgi:putative ABC transport system permease protein
MIDIVSYALIAFTSVSLVVSTVMIGIITYVSVVERIKEIGVIRSLGGRKKDVSRLFTAETVIIGLLAGLIGVAFTYGVSAIVNAILYPLIGIKHIAALPVVQALELTGLSILLTLISGVFPARAAAKKDPVVALRTE